MHNGLQISHQNSSRREFNGPVGPLHADACSITMNMCAIQTFAISERAFHELTMRENLQKRQISIKV